MAQISTKKSHLRHSHISPAPLTYLTCAISCLTCTISCLTCTMFLSHLRSSILKKAFSMDEIGFCRFVHGKGLFSWMGLSFFVVPSMKKGRVSWMRLS